MHRFQLEHMGTHPSSYALDVKPMRSSTKKSKRNFQLALLASSIHQAYRSTIASRLQKKQDMTAVGL